MPFRRRRPATVAVWLLLISMGFAGRAIGQVSDTVLSAPAVGIVIAHVADTAGTPLLEADITVTRQSDSVVVAVGKTNSRGVARLSGVPVGGPYAISARKIGYKPADTAGVYMREGGTHEVSFVLHPYIAVLPEVAATADTAPRLLARHGFLGIRLFKCLFIGFGDTQGVEKEFCSSNSDAHAARLAAKEAAGEFRRVMRRVQKENDAHRRPDPNQALMVLATAKTCNREIPTRPRWPLPDPDVRCRELLKRIPRDTLDHVQKVLEAIDAAAPFEAELRRIEEERRRREDEEILRRREAWRRIIDSVQAASMGR